MVIEITTTTLKLPQSLEDGCKDLCDKPYSINRVDVGHRVTWCGEKTVWYLIDGKWYKRRFEQNAEDKVPCEEPEYEQLYQRILRKKKTENFDVKFSLSIVGLLLVYAFSSWINFLFQ